MLDQFYRALVPYTFKLWMREWILTKYRIPYSRFDVPGPIVALFRGKGPLTILDVGASAGHFTHNLDKLCGVQKALLVEPIRTRCSELKTRFAGRPFAVACAAVGSEEGVAEMEVLNWDYSSSLLPIDRTDKNATAALDISVREKIRTRVAPLDVICAENQFFGKIDLLKIDVQGAEHLVLAGAPKTLQRTNTLWVEVSFRPLYHGGIRFEALYDLCRQSGFKLLELAEAFRGQDGELLCADALFSQAEAETSAKVLANGHTRL